MWEYTEQLGALIGERLSDGLSLKEIAQMEGMPSKLAMTRWAMDETHPFHQVYHTALKVWAHGFIHETLEIADQAVDRDSAAAATLKVRTRENYMKRLVKEIFGDEKQAGPTGPPVQIVIGTGFTDPYEQYKRDKEQQARERSREAEGPGTTEGATEGPGGSDW